MVVVVVAVGGSGGGGEAFIQGGVRNERPRDDRSNWI